jgi:type II secretory pathway component PulC
MKLNDLTLNLQLSQRMLAGICLGLSLLAALTLISSLWQWHNDWVFVHQTPEAPPLAKTDQTASLIAAIPQYHLFGKSQGQLPITNLQMTVTGIVKLSEQLDSLSKAYISINGQPGKVYKVGDALPYGVRIASISHDAVILENDGRFEKLPLPRDKLKFRQRSIREIA